MLVIDNCIGYTMPYEQAEPRKTRPNPFDALRGIIDAVDLPRGGRFYQYRHQAAG